VMDPLGPGPPEILATIPYAIPPTGLGNVSPSLCWTPDGSAIVLSAPDDTSSDPVVDVHIYFVSSRPGGGLHRITSGTDVTDLHVSCLN
jgi:hypothetical protein